MKRLLVCTLAALVMSVASQAFADPPHGKGKGHAKGHAKKAEHAQVEQRRVFVHDHHVVVHEYYDEQFRHGKCPPGLAKKNNGCMPPGQAKKWQVGRPLPRGVTTYDVPAVVITRLPPPPPGHRYVRVGGDILLVTEGSAIVIDALQYLARG